MTGRVDQLAFFRARLDDALRGERSTTLLRGEAEIGKARLLRAWIEIARNRGFKIGSSTNYPQTADAYASIAEACRILAACEPRAQPRDAADRALFARFLGLSALEADAREARWQKRWLFVIVREFLERLCGYAPVLLTMDDVQWIDPESLEVLEYLGATLDACVALVLAGRADEMRIVRSTHGVSLGPLATDGLHLANADAFDGERDPAYLVRHLIAAASIANAVGQAEASQATARAALEAAQRYGEPALIANCWTLLADFARQQGDFSLAQTCLDHAIETADHHTLTITAAYAR